MTFPRQMVHWVVNDVGGKILVPPDYPFAQYAAWDDEIDFSNVDAVHMFPGSPLTRVQAYLPMVVGIFVDTLVLGVILVLFCKWFINTQPTERKLLQCLVYWIVLAGIGGSGWFVAQMLQTFAAGFGDFANAGLRYYVRWFGVITVSSRLPALSFLLNRAYLLCDRKRWILYVFSPTLLVIAAFDIGSVAIFNSVNDAPMAKRLLGIGAALEVVVDFSLAIIIAVRLKKLKTGFPGTDRLISKLIMALAETQFPQATVALGFLVTSVAFPRSPAQFYVLFYPKVSTVLILIVLNSRTTLREQSSQGAFANGQKGNTSGSASASGSGGGAASRAVATTGHIPGTASHTASGPFARGRRSSRQSGVHFEGDEGTNRPFELLEMQAGRDRGDYHSDIGVNPYADTNVNGVKGKEKELDRVSEEDQRSTAPSEVAEERSIYHDGSKVRLVASSQ